MRTLSPAIAPATRPAPAPPSAGAAHDLLRQAMRGLASSVTIISSIDSDGNRSAMTATSTTALSMEPPSMLVCINRNSRFFQSLPQEGDFAINVLAADQVPVANLCAGKASGEERFGAGAWNTDESGVPYLADAQAVVICRQDHRLTYGTHEILVGKVRGVLLQRDIDPLVYADGGYRTLAS